MLRTAMQVIAVFLLFANAARAEPRASIVSELQALHNEVADFMSLEKVTSCCVGTKRTAASSSLALQKQPQCKQSNSTHGIVARHSAMSICEL